MHIPYQTVLVIHEERVNELVGKNREDPDNGIIKGVQRMWRDLQSILPQHNRRKEYHDVTQSTQELAMVGKK